MYDTKANGFVGSSLPIYVSEAYSNQYVVEVFVSMSVSLNSISAVRWHKTIWIGAATLHCTHCYQ